MTGKFAYARLECVSSWAMAERPYHFDSIKTVLGQPYLCSALTMAVHASWITAVAEMGLPA